MPLLPRAPGDKRTLVVDLETFPNWFCIGVGDGERVRTFASHRPGEIAKIAGVLSSKNVAVAGFNNFSYDDIILRTICRTPTIEPKRIHRLSNRIIDPQDEEETEANFAARYSETPWAYSIDVFQLLNGKGSLKEHACRALAADVGESPYEFGQDLPEESFEAVERYCQLDVRNTTERLLKLWKLVTLRTGLDAMFGLGARVYALTEQGIAQATFLKLHRDRTGQYSSEIREACRTNPDNAARAWPLTAIVSKKVQYHTGPFQAMLGRLLADGKLVAEDANGSKWDLKCPSLPADLSLPLAGHRFQLGVGGLHSIDGPGIFRATKTEKLIDLDVTSYYPSIIINEGLYPKHMGPSFVDNMRTLRDRRVEAKRAGDKVAADALKIVINATFGKLNDIWSPIRSTPDAMRVTINGQLFLLMLIEQLHRIGATIVSANTDGVTIKWGGDDALLALAVQAWQNATGYELERVDYEMVARRDVNNYVAKDTDGKVKLKGAFMLQPHQGHGLKIKEGPDNTKGDGLIIKRAAVAFLANRTPIRETIGTARPEEFLFYQRVKNGGVLIHDGMPIGRLARWYASVEGDSIRRMNPNGTFATLPHAHKATLAMTVDDIGLDIDFDHYAAEAEKLVRSCSP